MDMNWYLRTDGLNIFIVIFNKYHLFFKKYIFIVENFKTIENKEVPGCPVVRTLGFHCQGHRFNPWLRNYDLTSYARGPKKKERKNPNYKTSNISLMGK